MNGYRIDVNGVIRDMTQEEIKETEQMRSELPPPTPSLEDEVAQLKADNQELREALNALLERRVQ